MEQTEDFWTEVVAGHDSTFSEDAEMITSEVGERASSVNCTQLLRGGWLRQD